MKPIQQSNVQDILPLSISMGRETLMSVGSTNHVFLQQCQHSVSLFVIFLGIFDRSNRVVVVNSIREDRLMIFVGGGTYEGPYFRKAWSVYANKLFLLQMRY